MRELSAARAAAAQVLCVDNSEWMRNADYAPSRFQMQTDAVNLLAGAKTQSNPENAVGVLSLAGKVPKMLVTPTPDLGKVLNSLHGLEIQGCANVATGVQARLHTPSCLPRTRAAAGECSGRGVHRFFTAAAVTLHAPSRSRSSR